VRVLVFEMTNLEILDRFVAYGFWMWGIEFSEELDVCVFSLKAKPVGIIRKDMGTIGAAEFELVGLDTLGDDNSPGRGYHISLFVRKSAL
jgi:hypothetical protein